MEKTGRQPRLTSMTDCFDAFSCLYSGIFCGDPCISDIGKDSLAVLQWFILEWAGERSERGENEPNPILAYQLNKKFEWIFSNLTFLSQGREPVDKETYGELSKSFLVINNMWMRECRNSGDFK